MVRLKELREEKELSQTQLAKEINVNQRTISNWETGVSEPDIQAIKKLCEFFETTADYLLGFKEFET